VLEPTPWKEAQSLFGPSTWSRCEAWLRRRAKLGFYVLHCRIVTNTDRARRSYMKRLGLTRIVPGPLPHEYEIRGGKFIRHA
jgi:hypothetical protein